MLSDFNYDLINTNLNIVQFVITYLPEFKFQPPHNVVLKKIMSLLSFLPWCKLFEKCL